MSLLEEAFLLLEQLKGQDERTDEIIEEAIKRIQSDFDALMYDLGEMESALVRHTTETERRRIMERHPTVRWVDL